MEELPDQWKESITRILPLHKGDEIDLVIIVGYHC
jgi:hypothetical protein